MSNIFILERYITSLRNDQIQSENEILKVVKDDIGKKFKNIQSLITQIHYVKFDGKTVAESLLLPSDDLSAQKNINHFLQDATRKELDILDFLILQKNGEKVYHSSFYDRSLALNYNLFASPIIQNLEDQQPGPEFAVENTSSYILSNEQNSVLNMKGNIYDLQDMMNKRIVGHYLISISKEVLLGPLKNYIGKFKGDIVVADEKKNLLLTSSPIDSYRYMDKLFSVANGSTIRLDDEVIVLRTHLEPLGWEFFNVIPVKNIAYEVEELRKRMLLIILGVTLFSLLVMVFVSQIFTKRMYRLMQLMRNVWRDIPSNENEYIDPNHDEIGQVTRAFSQMNVRLRDYIDRVYVAEIQRRDAEIQLLQHKINPHFLFNTLEAIRMKAIQGGQEEVSEMIAVLGHLYRWNVKGNGMFVRIEEELDYIQSYLYLMKLRYKDRIQIEYNIPDEILNYGIPKITIQPIVENAVKYGIDYQSKSPNQININGRLDGHRLILSIQDNGNGIQSDRLYLIRQALCHEPIQDGNTGMGIANVHQRLRRLFGAEFGITIDSFPGKGTLVTLLLPARTVKEMNQNVQGADRG